MKTLSGHTQPFAVLGHPIGHTLSPAMHNAAFAELGLDAVYLAFDVRPERLTAVLKAMPDMGFVGANLTVPHKQAALRSLATLDDSARLLGAVNTVRFTSEGATGFNTDGYGFLKAFEEAFGRTVKGASLFVLGTGGAGRAVALVSAQEGASSITLGDMDLSRARTVAEEIASVNPSVTTSAAESGEWVEAVRRADIVVHATPIGMKTTDEAVLGPEGFREDQCAFDLIYNLPETAFMKSAVAGGARAANGLGMLLHQGARAFELWLGEEAPVDVMRSVLERSVYPS